MTRKSYRYLPWTSENKRLFHNHAASMLQAFLNTSLEYAHCSILLVRATEAFQSCCIWDGISVTKKISDLKSCRTSTCFIHFQMVVKILLLLENFTQSDLCTHPLTLWVRWCPNKEEPRDELQWQCMFFSTWYSYPCQEKIWKADN